MGVVDKIEGEKNIMCGFLTYFGSSLPNSAIAESADTIQYRGPDSSSYMFSDANISYVFHRLAIIGVSPSNNQPLVHPEDPAISMVCNGEIYNYKELISKFDLKPSTSSDCEVIILLYKKFGIADTIPLLDGVFAFTLFDDTKGVLYAARDPLGVRPMFIGTLNNEEYIFASEAKAIDNLANEINPFPPGMWWASDNSETFSRHYELPKKYDAAMSEDIALRDIRRSLVYAVEKRLMSEREVGCLLSGGLDSSLITALVAHMLKGYRLVDDEWQLFPDLASDTTLKTFCVGMVGSPDLAAAKKVANFISSDHNEVLLSESDFLDVIEDVIYRTESYDTTTIRASIGNYLVSKYIRENSGCKVIFNGDGSDEVTCGYVYNINAPTPDDLQAESVRLLEEIYMFDVLRSDRSISSNGLEARTPFLDKGFVDLYLSIPPEFKVFNDTDKVEKDLLRRAFESDNLLPDDILWRHKCAFSDGVSSPESSWHKTLQSHIDGIISDEDFEKRSADITHCKPLLKESLYYRDIFNSLFCNRESLTSHFWMPRWTNVIDPSARELSGYRE